MVYKNSRGVNKSIKVIDTASQTKLSVKVKRFTNDFPDIITGTISYAHCTLLSECKQILNKNKNEMLWE